VAQLHLQFIDHLEDIGGKPFDPSEFFHVHLPPCPRADDARLPEQDLLIGRVFSG
jgi:hypothetical protein